MSTLKQKVKLLYGSVTWAIAKLLSNFTSKAESDSILLIPAASLNGGFGEDLMVVSFLSNFSNNKQVTILTGTRIERPEYRSINPNISFVGGFHNDKVNFVSILNLIKRHKLVYVIGADIMDGTYKINTAINRLRVIELANNVGVEAQVSGFSVSKNISPIVKKKFIEIAKIVPMKLRDIESFKRMNEFIPKENLILTNDIAFICPNIPSMYTDKVFSGFTTWVEKAKKNNRRIIAVCPNSIQANKFGLTRYIKEFQDLLNKFLESDSFSLVFLYHDLRPLCGSETDSTISEKMNEHFTLRGVDCFYTKAITNGVQLKGYLSLSDFTITGRMHLGISGLTYQKPMFGIAYANKFEGMLKLFNVKPSMCLADYDKMLSSDSQIKDFVNNFPEIQQNVTHSLPKVTGDTHNNLMTA